MVYNAKQIEDVINYGPPSYRLNRMVQAMSAKKQVTVEHVIRDSHKDMSWCVSCMKSHLSRLADPHKFSHPEDFSDALKRRAQTYAFDLSNILRRETSVNNSKYMGSAPMIFTSIDRVKGSNYNLQLLLQSDGVVKIKVVVDNEYVRQR